MQSGVIWKLNGWTLKYPREITIEKGPQRPSTVRSFFYGPLMHIRRNLAYILSFKISNQEHLSWPVNKIMTHPVYPWNPSTENVILWISFMKPITTTHKTVDNLQTPSKKSKVLSILIFKSKPQNFFLWYVKWTTTSRTLSSY